MKHNVPFMDLARLHDSIQPELDDAMRRVISNSAFIGGEEVEAFEEEFSRAHNLVHGSGCGSGTDALALALRALGVGPGDEVIVPAMTFVATAEAVHHVGAVPVLADVDAESLLLTPEGVDAVRTERTRAVIPVHLYGHIVPFDYIDSWKKESLVVVEDAAQAHIGTWNGEYVGSHSDAACFSFYPGKNLGALGDGGMVVSVHENVIEEVKRLRDHGRVSKFVHEIPGWCSRLDGLQAAVLRTKLRHLEAWTESRRQVAARYSSHIKSLLVPWQEGAVHHLVVARVPARDQIAKQLDAAGIATGLHYPMSLSRQPWLSDPGRQLEASEQAARETLSLPIDPLMQSADVDLIARLLFDHVEQEYRHAPSRPLRGRTQ